MAYDFQRLADVELLEEVPEGASAFVEVDGTVKRVPGSGLGGGGIATAILRFTESAAPRASNTQATIPITCDNMTFEQAKAILQSGQPLMVIMFADNAWIIPSFLGWYVDEDDETIAVIELQVSSNVVYWYSGGFSSTDPYIEE